MLCLGKFRFVGEYLQTDGRYGRNVATCKSHGYEEISDPAECALADLLLNRMGKNAAAKMHKSLNSRYYTHDVSIRQIPAGCTWHAKMPGQDEDYVNIHIGSERQCGNGGFLCICKLPHDYYKTRHNGTMPAKLIAAEKQLMAENQAKAAMKLLWYKQHGSPHPTTAPTVAPSAAPTQYNKCGCGTFWETSQDGSFCTMCPSGEFQPHPHNGSVTACLPCPQHHFSATGACACTDHGF